MPRRTVRMSFRAPAAGAVIAAFGLAAAGTAHAVQRTAMDFPEHPRRHLRRRRRHFVRIVGGGHGNRPDLRWRHGYVPRHAVIQRRQLQHLPARHPLIRFLTITKYGR